MSEELLKTTWRMIHDIMTPPPVRADLIKQVIKWGDLEPRPNAALEGTRFSLTLNIGDVPERSRTVVVEAAPLADRLPDFRAQDDGDTDA